MQLRRTHFISRRYIYSFDVYVYLFSVIIVIVKQTFRLMQKYFMKHNTHLSLYTRMYTWIFLKTIVIRISTPWCFHLFIFRLEKSLADISVLFILLFIYLCWFVCVVNRSPSKPLVRRLVSRADWETVSRNSVSDECLETQSLPNRSCPGSPNQWVLPSFICSQARGPYIFIYDTLYLYMSIILKDIKKLVEDQNKVLNE